MRPTGIHAGFHSCGRTGPHPVLARKQGLVVRRDGGLGSDASFAMNGLTDEQIRFFLDGVPLELVGFPFGVANVPVNLLARVETYRGVVPIRVGADALGGAVNLVRRDDLDDGGSASYQVGAFGTHRATGEARLTHAGSGLYVSGALFLDRSDNDYLVDVMLAGDDGSQRPVSLPRFHDAYAATGVVLEVGASDRPWARRLSLRGFASDHDKELQHNPTMEVVYGEAIRSERVLGATARYDVVLAPGVELELLATYAYRVSEFRDPSRFRYDWQGRPSYEFMQGEGEVLPYRSDQVQWQHHGFARLGLAWQLARGHQLRFAVSPTLVGQTGDEGKVVGNKLVQVITWADAVTFEQTPESGVVVYDTDTALSLVMDERCPDISNRVGQDSEGNLYFGNWIWSVGFTLTGNAKPNCVLRMKAGETTLDAGWQYDYAAHTEGREGAMYNPYAPGKALITVFFHERAGEITDETDPYELAGSPHWQLWSIDMVTGEGTPVSGMDWNVGAVSSYIFGGRTFVSAPVDNGTWETHFFEIVDGAAVPTFKARGWSFQLVQIR